MAVAIPVRDEVEHISACLEALDGQIDGQVDHIVLLVNNSSDGTAVKARGFRPRPGTRLHVLERCLPVEYANAGHARRLAMEAAATLVGRGGVLLTTDADSRVDPDWVSATLKAMRAGAEVVAGWVELNPLDWGRIPQRLHEDDARECAYDALCDELHGRLDNDPSDPLPRHTQHSGASIAVTVNAFRQCGGVPPQASGEDRALMAVLRRVDARIRHAPEVRVVVSGRMIGRAVGGMADTIRRRMERSDSFLDDRLEPAWSCVRRAAARSALRRVVQQRRYSSGALAYQLQIPRPQFQAILDAAKHFGVAWEQVEAASPVLEYRRVAVSCLAQETAVAASLVGGLRSGNLDADSLAGMAFRRWAKPGASRGSDPSPLKAATAQGGYEEAIWTT